jgi:hypothetical protein
MDQCLQIMQNPKLMFQDNYDPPGISQQLHATSIHHLLPYYCLSGLYPF